MCSLVHAGLLVFLARRSRLPKPALGAAACDAGSPGTGQPLGAAGCGRRWNARGRADANRRTHRHCTLRSVVHVPAGALARQLQRAPHPAAQTACARWRPPRWCWPRWSRLPPPLAAPSDAVAQYAGLARLTLPVLGLLMVEQVFRNAPEDARWNVKPVCLGLGTVFAFDVYLFAEATMFSRLDTDVLHARPAVHALAVPFLVVAANRRWRLVATAGSLAARRRSIRQPWSSSGCTCCS
ncbi:MAG: hypothetical protein MZW92_27095 [Comamonadaceae bacterium]|nr:hypothetical protein [Comamonadaceae bacterium]